MLTILTEDGKVYYGRLERHTDAGTIINPLFRWEDGKWRDATLVRAIGFRTTEYPEITDLTQPNG